MPFYDYECQSCGHSFEEFQSMSDKPLSICPQCKKHRLVRLIAGGTGVIFKGSGFYVNDSRSTNSKAQANSENNSSEKRTSKENNPQSSQQNSPSESTNNAPKKTEPKASSPK